MFSRAPAVAGAMTMLLPRGAAIDRSDFHNPAQLKVALQQQKQRLGVYDQLQGPQGVAQLQQAAQALQSASAAPALTAANAADAFAADAVARIKLDTGLKDTEALSGSRALYELAVSKGIMSPDGQIV